MIVQQLHSFRRGVPRKRSPEAFPGRSGLVVGGAAYQVGACDPAVGLSGFPPAFVNCELFAPFKLLSVVAAILHIIPKGAADGVVPRTNMVVIDGFLLMATALAITVLAVRPDPRPLIVNMPAKLRDFRSTGAQLVRRPSPAGCETLPVIRADPAPAMAGVFVADPALVEEQLVDES